MEEVGWSWVGVVGGCGLMVSLTLSYSECIGLRLKSLSYVVIFAALQILKMADNGSFFLFFFILSASN